MGETEQDEVPTWLASFRVIFHLIILWLFRHEGTQWYAYPWYHIIWTDACTPTRQAWPLHLPMSPATPTATTHNIHLTLPIPGLIQPSSTVSHPISILVWLTTPPVQWTAPLWHNIWPHAHMDTLCFHILANTCILIVSSDAAVHPDRSGTCAWTIWANSELWNGKGHVPASPNDMYSGLAEAFGLYMALSFFHQYCTYHPVIMSNPWTVHIYCNNKGVLDHTRRQFSGKYPWDAISDDYLVYAVTSNHQSTQTNKGLTSPHSWTPEY